MTGLAMQPCAELRQALEDGAQLVDAIIGKPPQIGEIRKALQKSFQSAPEGLTQ